jgi:hypothetical protein
MHRKHWHTPLYKQMPPNPRQDNKTYINFGSGLSEHHVRSIRFPKKCRKTAWKRFYRLFPRLKPGQEDV